MSLKIKLLIDSAERPADLMVLVAGDSGRSLPPTARPYNLPVTKNVVLPSSQGH